MGDEDRVTHYHLPAGSPQIPDELGAITGIDLLSHSVEKIVLARQQSNQGEDVIVMALSPNPPKDGNSQSLHFQRYRRAWELIASLARTSPEDTWRVNECKETRCQAPQKKAIA